MESKKTFERTLDAKPNDHSIVKPGELIDIVEMTPLTLSDRRIYNLLIANVWEHIGEERQHSIRKSELLNGLHKGTDRLDASVQRLMSAIVQIKVIRRDKWETKRVQLLGANVIPEAEDGLIHYDFHPFMRKIIKESRVFARLQKKIMFALSSKYSLALYEIIQKRGNLKKKFEILPIMDLRNFLGVPPGKLSSWINFRNKAITPAVAEVSDLSEFVVSIEPVKRRGREFSDVRISWQRKTPTAPRKTERRLGPANDGATAEPIAPGETFASLPSLRGDTLQKAKALLPEYDIHYVEGEWRAWADEKAAPRNADAAFLGFCKAFQKNRSPQR